MEMISESPVLLLNADYTPIRVIEWQRAICMVLDKKVTVISQRPNKLIRSARTSFPWPSTVALKKYVKNFGEARLSRRNIFLRDRYRCCYCGSSPIDAENFISLTADHVTPRTKSEKGLVPSPFYNKKVAVNSWYNLVTACSKCNNRKGAKTVEAAGMNLMIQPKKPTRLQLMKIFWSFREVPDDWKNFL